MDTAIPLCCTPEAFTLLARQVPAIESSDALVHGAIALSMHQVENVKPEDVDAAFDKALAFGAEGLLNAVDTFINSRRSELSARAAKYKLPFVYSDVEYVLAGGLIALGPGHYEGYRNAAKYAHDNHHRVP